MTYNKHGIPIDKREQLHSEVYEYLLPHGAIKKYKIDRRLGSIIAIVRSFKLDALYIKGNPAIVAAKIEAICGQDVFYSKLQKGA